MALFIVFDSLSIGGIERKIVDLCTYYSKTSTKVYLLLKNSTGLLLPQIPSNITIVSPSFFLPLRNLFFWLWLYFQIKKYQPKLILSFGNYYAIQSLFSKLIFRYSVPIIVSEDSSINIQLQTDSFSFLRQQLVKLLYPTASKIILLTPASRQKLQNICPHIRPKTIILKNWLPLTTSPKTALSAKNYDLLFLGRFANQKNPLEFLRIYRKVLKQRPTTTAAMVGTGPLLPKIKAYISHHNLPIKLFSPTTNVAQFYQQSKILLITSVHEGFPLTILEAFSHGCLVISKQLPETSGFFDYYPDKIFFQKKTDSIKKIIYFFNHQKAQNDLVTHYRLHILRDQKINFRATVNYLNRYL